MAGIAQASEKKRGSPEPASGGSSQRVYFGVMQDLEQGRMVPGQRIVETDLAQHFGVGRNAVREAIQQLAARGVVDLSRNRSPMIRTVDFDEAMEILDVASALTALMLRAAAMHYVADTHDDLLAFAMHMLTEADEIDEPGMFSRARRNFYRTLLVMGRNRELQRIFPAVGMHILYAQYQSRRLRGVRIADYRRIIAVVSSGDADAAEQAGKQHVANVRQIIRELAGVSG